MQTNNSQ